LKIEKIINDALSKGNEFAEIYVEEKVTSSITIRSKKIVQEESLHGRGTGVRTLQQNEVNYRWTKEIPKVPFKYPEETCFSDISHIEILPESIHREKKVEYLRGVEASIYKFDKRIKDAILAYQDKVQDLVIINSEGLFVRGRRVEIILLAIAIAEQGGKRVIGGALTGGTIGLELFDKQPYEELATEAARSALQMINYRRIPSGKLPIIFANKSGIFHECVGHALEARHRHGAFKDKLNEQLTSKPFTVIDDPTIPAMGGSFSFDDEGTKSGRKVLIDKGVLRNFMYDRHYAKKYGVKSTGNARRVSYKFPPCPRMSNLVIKPGDASFQEILRETKNGIMALSGSGGKSGALTGTYMLPFFSAVYIENGEISYPLQPFIYQGSVLKTLQNIDWIGNDFIHVPTGRCGIDQIITVTYSAPSIRLKEAENITPIDMNQIISSMKNLKL
jgi:TldD protein